MELPGIVWSYRYKPPHSNIQYQVTNTCPIDTNLQMIFFLWMRGFVPHSVVEKDSLLLDTLICIRRGDFDKARHDVLSDRCFTDSYLGNQLQGRVKTIGNTEYWSCEGCFLDYRPFCEIFKAYVSMQKIWGVCSKMGESCPLHPYFEFQSKKQRHQRWYAVHINHSSTMSVQEEINQKYPMTVDPCQKGKDTEGSEADHDHCPQKGTRQARSVPPCPWVMTIHCNTGVTIFLPLMTFPNKWSFPQTSDIPLQV